MSKVNQSSGGSAELAEAAQLATRHSAIFAKWDSPANAGKTLVIQYADRPPVRVTEKFQLDMTTLRGATGFGFVAGTAASDRKGGVSAAGLLPTFEKFETRAPSLLSFAKINTAPKDKSLRKTGPMTPKGQTSGGVKTGAKQRGPSNTGPFASAKESRIAQDVLTRMKHGTVTTLDGGWGPKSEKAFSSFMDSLGLVAPQDTKEATRLILHLPMTSIVKTPSDDSHPELSYYRGARDNIANSFRTARKANDKQAMLATLRDLARMDELANSFAEKLTVADVPSKDYQEFMALVQKYPAPAADPYAAR